MRGPHPEDARAFGPEALPTLQTAVAEVGWLLDRGYPSQAAGTIVGDHHQLTSRQRRAIMRCACGAVAAERRARRRVAPEAMAGQVVLIDGFNLLLTVEAALGGQVLLLGQDGCLRDMASGHGRLVGADETPDALELVGARLQSAAPAEVRWLFDAPVPHSGRLARTVEDFGVARGWPWRAQTVQNPDPVLKAAEELVVTADGPILDLSRGVNLARCVVEGAVPEARTLPLDGWLPTGALQRPPAIVAPGEPVAASRGSNGSGGRP